MIAGDLEEGRVAPPWSAGSSGLPISLSSKGRTAGQLVAAPVEADAHEADVGHALTSADSAASRRCLITWTGSGGARRVMT
jgi:hypothetical protein